MCGRYTLSSPLDAILSEFVIPGGGHIPFFPSYTPRYNIAPTQQVLIVREADDGRRELAQATWKLIPPGSPEPKTHLNTINAKAETIATSYSYRSAFKSRRCLIPLNGWYEYPIVGGTKSNPIKQPYLTHRVDGKLFAFAGLWERWQGNGLTVNSCTIVTTEPSAWFRQYHHREPVILHESDYATWLDREFYDRAKLESLLVAFPADRLEAYPVSAAVGNVKNQGPELADRVEVR